MWNICNTCRVFRVSKVTFSAEPLDWNPVYVVQRCIQDIYLHCNSHFREHVFCLYPKHVNSVWNVCEPCWDFFWSGSILYMWQINWLWMSTILKNLTIFISFQQFYCTFDCSYSFTSVLHDFCRQGFFQSDDRQVIWWLVVRSISISNWFEGIW